MSIPHLLRLPRELRDLIYMYALTEPNDLIYHTGRNKMSRICARQRHHHHVDGKRKGQLSFSYLLRIARLTFSPSRDDVDERPSYNQLQYVNRVLYLETHGLEFYYNTIVFKDNNYLNAGQRCLGFVNQITDKEFSHYLKASVSYSQLKLDLTNGGGPFMLTDFCRMRPNATIQIRVPEWSQRDSRFLLSCILFLDVFRDSSEILVQFPAITMGDFNLARLAVKLQLPDDDLPRNFRWFPSDEQFDRSALLEACRDGYLLQDENSETWFTTVEKWFEEGL